MVPKITDVTFARDNAGIISDAGLHIYTNRRFAQVHEITGKKHPLVDNMMYLEANTGVWALTIPQVIALRNGDPTGEVSGDKLHEWTDAPTTFQSFELLDDVHGYERGDRVLLVAHTPLPHGISSGDMLIALAEGTMCPRYGFPLTNKQGLERLNTLKDSYRVLTPDQAREEAEGQHNLLAGTHHGILLPGTASPEAVIDATTGYQTGAYNKTLHQRTRKPLQLFGSEILSNNGAWLASFVGYGIGVFVGDNDFVNNSRFLVGSAGGATVHDASPEQPATEANDQDLEAIAQRS